MSLTASDAKEQIGVSAVYRLWGGLDIVYLLSYVYFALAKGKTPFVEDGLAIVQNLKEFEEIGGAFYESLYLMYFMSLAVSGVMLLLRKPVGKLIAYIQTPFRLVFMIPSVSVLIFIVPYFEASNAVLLTALVMSEIAKVGTLMRCGK